MTFTSNAANEVMKPSAAASTSAVGVSNLCSLLAIADDEISNVLLGPADLRWLYHPYNGGADVILPTRAERDALKDRHPTWLSTHPSGL
ncbi:DUF3885 domain-containing protein [Sphaerisporangium fuscum]|uniref:DUF3885 domain-containing protein n=1 Tax=Sphaerisporangium fuscum TaxID=2835868 RepID=UPI001BDCB64C|nr:hypothetical protein [Sphaerisporangium fuscum]